jgi:putative tryptophan/tyrosine transport system substrate-binding protein
MEAGMRRREFLALLGGSTAAWPLAARAQHRNMPVIGFLSGESPGLFADRLRAFRQGLDEAGFVESRNVAIEYRWARGEYDRLPALAADLVRQLVTVMVATTTPALLAAKAATSTIPIVFSTGGDPVQMGLAASLNRPGGNMTGVSNLTVETGAKQIELLHELIPAATLIALLVNPTNPVLAGSLSRDLQTAARTMRQQILVVGASTESDVNTAFTTLVEKRVSALVVGNDPFFNSRPDQLVALAARHAVPAIYPFREFAVAGGLMSYGSNLADPYRLVGVYTGRILNGKKPADLPIQQVAKVEFVINLKTAQALGLTFPITLLGRADEVIE